MRSSFRRCVPAARTLQNADKTHGGVDTMEHEKNEPRRRPPERNSRAAQAAQQRRDQRREQAHLEELRQKQRKRARASHAPPDQSRRLEAHPHHGGGRRCRRAEHGAVLPRALRGGDGLGILYCRRDPRRLRRGSGRQPAHALPCAHRREYHGGAALCQHGAGHAPPAGHAGADRDGI